MFLVCLTLVLIFLGIINVIIYATNDVEQPFSIHCGMALVLVLAASVCFYEWYKEGFYNYQAKVNTKMECTSLKNEKSLPTKKTNKSLSKEVLILDKESKNLYKVDDDTTKQIIELLNKQEQ